MSDTTKTADSRSKRRKRRAARGWWITVPVNRDRVARSSVKQQIKSDPEAPIVETKRWIDWS